MNVKSAKQLKTGDIINGFDSVTNVRNAGDRITVYTLCNIHNFQVEQQIEVGSMFHAWVDDEAGGAAKFFAESWADAKAKAIERLELVKYQYQGKFVVCNLSSNERKSYKGH